MTGPDLPELTRRRPALDARYEAFRSRGMKLDLTRGKPSAEQLDLSRGLLDALDDHRSEDGTDCRNYGGLDGLPEARRLFAEIFELVPDQLLVGGNSSLQLMANVLFEAMIHGVPGSDRPWRDVAPAPTVLCPVPGYDRHFALAAHVGMRLVPVGMDAEGPRLEEVRDRVRDDASVRAIWCVPKYSNPTGITYSPRVVEELANLETAAPDFRILWDNAYAVHAFRGELAPLSDVLGECQRAGHPNRTVLFGSTSKVTFAGAGVGIVGASEPNLAWLRRSLSMQTIGPDKLNQLRHVRFLRDRAGVETHMARHAAILRPRFEAVDEVLTRELGGLDIATWTRPDGGYFVSLDVPPGCAAAVVEMAAEAGVKLTPAGATWPGGKDPEDRNIRIAPSMPPVDDVRSATELLAICVQRVVARRADAR